MNLRCRSPDFGLPVGYVLACLTRYNRIHVLWQKLDNALPTPQNPELIYCSILPLHSPTKGRAHGHDPIEQQIDHFPPWVSAT